MEYAIIGICVVAVMAVCVLLFCRARHRKGGAVSLENTPETVRAADCSDIVVDDESEKFEIPVEILPEGMLPDKNQLSEIVDSKVLTYVSNLVPALGQVGNASHNVARAVKSGDEVVYRAIIPAGAKLADSKAMTGAVRGYYHGTNGIGGHANFVRVKAQKGMEVVTNSSAAIMGVASMVVGQYYMAQIHTELEGIGENISQILDFQENEYKSRVFSLITHVRRIAEFQVEILENNELRLSKISQLDSLEEECTKLLGQTNLTLEKYTEEKDSDYGKYEKKLKKAHHWYLYQKSLLSILYRISELRYTLHLGAVSREQCTALLPTYTKQVESIQGRLTNWHQKTMERLKIDPQKIRRKREGFDLAIHSIPGVFNHSLRFKSINKNTVSMITEQASGYETGYHRDMTDLYAEDVQLIATNGKIYYLPKNNETYRV